MAAPPTFGVEPFTSGPGTSERISRPKPSQLLKSLGTKAGLKVTETNEFSVLFSIPSPLASVLSLKMLDSKSRDNFTELEISYITNDGTKTVQHTFGMHGLQWVGTMDSWSIMGKIRPSEKVIHAALEKTMKESLKLIRKTTDSLDIGDVKNKTELALRINEKLSLGLNPLNLEKIMNMVSIWS